MVFPKLPNKPPEWYTKRFAKKRLEEDLPFFIALLESIGVKGKPCEEISQAIVDNWNIIFTDQTIGIILGAFSESDITLEHRSDVYGRLCMKFYESSLYIPLFEDKIADIHGEYPPGEGLIVLVKSRVYPTGRILKSLLPKETIIKIKEQINEQQSNHS